ncbi:MULTISPECIES: hypothetical protein [Kitasatospora]|uniref:Secreted protein n=1 Tax=Kitasatospora cathayae TaxID=3004092 RepID=A0ABY7Q5K3_9ACTN|nr:hypothetical protein [Kitasatospora sp. HUAS 3-15]WBP87975.1 hypothetical protein O1G21_20450 [Kitasatospora sp. HUAS 3-15]
MARINTRRASGFLLAVPLAAGLLLAGAGVAAADNGAAAGTGSNAGVVSDTGTGNVFGGVDGNYVSTQQTATGSGASNQNNTLAVKGNAGNVLAGQGNKNVDVIFSPNFR